MVLILKNLNNNNHISYNKDLSHVEIAQGYKLITNKKFLDCYSTFPNHTFSICATCIIDMFFLSVFVPHICINILPKAYGKADSSKRKRNSTVNLFFLLQICILVLFPKADQ